MYCGGGGGITSASTVSIGIAGGALEPGSSALKFKFLLAPASASASAISVGLIGLEASSFKSTSSSSSASCDDHFRGMP
jgi:hypothetical protein